MPFVSTCCSVPVCISDVSLSMPVPPMPIHVAEYVFVIDAFTVGTVHDALTLVTMGSGDVKLDKTA